MLEEFGLALPAALAKKVEDDICKLRPEFCGMEYRYFYAALAGQRFVILHVITKNTQRLRRRDIEIARRRLVEVRERFGREGPPPIRTRTDRP